MKLTTVLSASALALALVSVSSQGDVAAQGAKKAAPAASGVPTFKYDKTFPKPLPNNWKIGQVVGVSVDTRNHIWIVQRPGTLKDSEREALDGSYGGMKGAVGLAEDPSDASVSCRQVGPITFKGKLKDGEDVFRESRSWLFKKLQVVRFYDWPNNSLVYLSYSDKLVEGSPKNTISTVPIMPWGQPTPAR